MVDQVQNEIADLNQEFDSIDDPRECYILLQKRIRQHKADGEKIPKDLELLERHLMRECMAASQGR